MNENVYAAITGIPMDFGGFVEAMKERLREKYPGCEVKTAPVSKNNGLCLTGITILPPERTVAPNIYMDEPYTEYLAGRPLEDIFSGVVRLYEENAMEEDPALPDLTDFGAVKDLICFRIINRERNRERLAGMPHRDFLDLAIVYFIPVAVSDSCGGSITVTGQIFSQWQTDEETVYQCAVENTRRLYPVSIMPMVEMVREIMGADAPKELFMETGHPICPPLYVLRCHKGDTGSAAALLYPDILREFAGKHGDFYILPSSIYEVLLLPAEPEPADPAYLCGMVRAVNEEQVSPDVVLADDAYVCHEYPGEIDVLE